MIIYSNEKELIATSIGDINRNVNISSIYLDAESFKCKENRFFKIVKEDVVKRNLKHFSQESMQKESIKRFKETAKIFDSLEYYDTEKNIGYKVFPGMKKPTVYTYSMLYPAITEFFRYWRKFNHSTLSVQDSLYNYDLSKLFTSMDNFKYLECIFTKQQGKMLKKTLYKEFPDFAIFYYEIYPFLNIKTVRSYDISKVLNARLLVHELGLNTKQLDSIIDSMDVAEHNTKILKLINNSK